MDFTPHSSQQGIWGAGGQETNICHQNVSSFQSAIWTAKHCGKHCTRQFMALAQLGIMESKKKKKKKNPKKLCSRKNWNKNSMLIFFDRTKLEIKLKKTKNGLSLEVCVKQFYLYKLKSLWTWGSPILHFSIWKLLPQLLIPHTVLSYLERERKSVCVFGGGGWF